MPDKTDSSNPKSSSLPSPTMPRVNVVAIVVFLALALLGGAFSLLTNSPAGVLVGLVVGVIAAQ